MARPAGHKAVVLFLAWLVTMSSVMAESQWSEWYNSDTPGTLPQDVDNETLDTLITLPCALSEVTAVQCRQVNSSATFSHDSAPVGGNVLRVPCNRSGLLCRNQDQPPRPLCADYEIRVLCSADLSMTSRVAAKASSNSNSTQQQQLGLYNVSSETTTPRRDAGGSSSNDISTNGGFIAMAAGGSVILPLVCVLVIQLRKSKRLERLRREQARQAAEDLRRSEEQRNGGQDRPPAYEELFGATTSLVPSGSGSSSSSSSHPTESMSVASGFLSLDSGVGLDGGDVSLERVAVVVVDGSAAGAAYARGRRLAGSQVSLLHGRTSVVSTTSTTSTMLSFDASSAPSSPTTADAGSSLAVAVVSSGAMFTFPNSSSSSSSNSSSSSPSANGRAATPLRGVLPLSEAEENADLGHASSSSNRVPPVVLAGLTADEARETRSGAAADRFMPLPTIVVSSESRSRRSSAESSFSQASCSSTDILLPPAAESPSNSAVRARRCAVTEFSIRGPVSGATSAESIRPGSEIEGAVELGQVVEAEARSEGQSAVNSGQGSRGESAVTVSAAEGQEIGALGSSSSNSPTAAIPVASSAAETVLLAPAARAQRRLSLPHNGPPPTYDCPSYSNPLPASAVLYVPSSSSGGRGSNLRSLSTSAAPLLAYLTSSTSTSSSQTAGSARVGQAEEESPRADGTTPAMAEVVVVVGEPPAVPPPPPTPLPQRPARRFLGMHLSIFDLMAALYQSPDPAATVPPPSYDDALKILAAKGSKPETNSTQGIQNTSTNRVV